MLKTDFDEFPTNLKNAYKNKLCLHFLNFLIGI